MTTSRTRFREWESSFPRRGSGRDLNVCNHATEQALYGEVGIRKMSNLWGGVGGESARGGSRPGTITCAKQRERNIFRQKDSL